MTYSSDLDLGDLPTWLQAGATIIALAIAVGAPLLASRTARRRQEAGAVMTLDHAFLLIDHYVRDSRDLASQDRRPVFNHGHLDQALDDLKSVDRGVVREAVARRLYDCRTLLLDAAFFLKRLDTAESFANPSLDALTDSRDRLADRLEELCHAARCRLPSALRDHLKAERR